MKRIKIEYTPEDYMKCEEFAHEQLETSINHYRRRNQGNRDKIVEDIVVGKLGEIGSSRYLRGIGIEVGEPCFEIFNSRGKSFKADLTDGSKNFHCKAQSEDSVKRYGTSWILQYGGTGYGHTDKLFKCQSPGEYLVPCTVDTNHITIFGIIPIIEIFERDLIKMPRVAWLQNTKRAIYLEDLATIPVKNRWNL